MSWEKNYKNRDQLKNRNQNERKKAYQPVPPFKTVEGVGTQPFNRLSPHSVWVLLRFYAKFTGFNRNDLSLTYGQVKSAMSNLLFSRSIWELIGFGFIDVKRFGRLERNCSIFSFSNRWRSLADDSKRCDAIQAILEEIEHLMRERGSAEKRARIRILRNSLFKVQGKI
jgi:hypothetical protein